MPPAAGSPSRLKAFPLTVDGQSLSQARIDDEEIRIGVQDLGLSSGQSSVGQSLSKSQSGDVRNQEVLSGQPRVEEKTKTRSYANVAKKHIFTKQKFVVSEIDGKEKVVVPREVFVGAKPLWEDFLIGKFLNTKAPHVGKIHMIVNKIWRLGDKSSLIDVFHVNDTTVKFRIRNEGMRQRVLNRGMWNLMDLPMIVSKWTPFTEETQPAMKSIPLWITLSNVPPAMFTDKGLEFLSSAVGKPIRLHPKTEACVSFDEAQILVEADLTKELPKEYVVTGEEEGEMDTTIKYAYPWLPPRCSCCKKWGHLRDTCLSPENKINPVCVETERKTEEKEELRITQTSLEETEPTVTAVLVDKAREDEEPLWITPSKTSSISNQKKEDLKYGEVSIMSNSFAALGDNEEDVETIRMEELVVVGEEGNRVDVAISEKPVETEIMEEITIVTQSESIKAPAGIVGKNRGVPPRPSLPRGSKSAHKTVSIPLAQSTKDQSKKVTPTTH